MFNAFTVLSVSSCTSNSPKSSFSPRRQRSSAVRLLRSTSNQHGRLLSAASLHLRLFQSTKISPAFTKKYDVTVGGCFIDVMSFQKRRKTEKLSQKFAFEAVDFSFPRPSLLSFSFTMMKFFLAQCIIVTKHMS